MRLTRYERVSILIRLMRTRSIYENTFTKLSRVPELDMSYSTIRDLIVNHYPHCFEHRPTIGWQVTGAQPEPDIPFDFNQPPFPQAATGQHATNITQPEPVPYADKPGRSRWTWSQEALRYLDTLWPGQSFAEVLQKAHSNNALDEIVIIGKTMAKAAQDMKARNGEVPY